MAVSKSKRNKAYRPKPKKELKYASCNDLQKAVQSFEASKELARAGRIPSLSLVERDVVAA